MRPNIFGKAMALNGDKTTTGATCIATIQTVGCYQKMALRVGDPTTVCPKCGETGTIITGENRINNHGKAQAIEGSIVRCGCPVGSNVVIAITPNINIMASMPTITPENFSSQTNISQKNNLYLSPIIDIADPKYYTVTIYIAAPGTLLNDKNTGAPDFDSNGVRNASLAGHMWFRIKKISGDVLDDISYGFGPIVSGGWGEGEVVITDNVHYENPFYSRTIEITETQYKKLKEFGDRAIQKDQRYFELNYNGANNSCIDFTNKALRFAGLNPNAIPINSATSTTGLTYADPTKYEGTMRVIRNIPAIKAIPAPFPDSKLNQEKYNKIPTRPAWKSILD
ncbi:TPA: PAAR domain-containing protein [Proteus mirabilis]